MTSYMRFIVALTMLVCGNGAFAQEENITNQLTPAPASFVEYEDDFIPPSYTTTATVNASPLNRLRYILGYKGSNRDAKYLINLSKSLPKSKFQLIVDENGNIIDCTLLKSSNISKDKTVLNFLPSSHFFNGPATPKGEPCKSVVILTMGYYPNGDLDHNMQSYPLIAIPDSGLKIDTISSSQFE